MEPDRWRRVGEIYEAVSGLEGAALEEALDRECGGDDALRREVVSLLAAGEDAEVWLAGLTARAGIPNPEAEAALNAPGREIGSWRLVRQIGRGGMGVVYLAERADEQFRMQAALKALPVGLITRDAVARFQREREILAALEHPNIARLLDGGVTDEGTPFYVMEYVEGLPIHDYCAEHELSLAGRLALFEKVAEAVSYAHRHLVIHRDVKPANILVTDAGEPKLLDFGVAKLVETESEARGTATALAQRRVTPAYTAPELLQGDPATTACDVYSLGVVLYELLSGRPPFEAGLFEGPGWTDRLAAYRPPPPSRAVASGALRQKLKGDLDNIVAMAMHPDPARRYATVNALIKDLERYRAHQPVTARPDTLGYRASRFVRRHAVSVALSTLAALSLVAGMGVALWQAEEARRQAAAAAVAAERAVAARDFLVGLFKATVPDVPPDEMPDTESLLAAGTEQVTNAEALDPVLRADMLAAIGEIYRVRGQHEKAEPLLDDARQLATDFRERAPEVYTRAIIAWSRVLIKQGNLAEAIQMLEDLVAFLEDQVPGSPLVLEARFELGWKYSWRRGDDRGLEIMRAVNRAVQGRDDVTGRFRRRLKKGLANLLFTDGQYAAAEPLYEEAIEIERNLKGPGHRELAVKLVNAASNDLMLGQFEEANERYERGLSIHHEIGDAPSESHAAAHVNYGSALAWQGRVEKALEQQRKAVELATEFRGLDSPEEYPLRDYRAAAVLSEVGRPDEAAPLLEKALQALDPDGTRRYTWLLTNLRLARARCFAGDETAGKEFLSRFREETADREFVSWIQAEVLETEAHCDRAAGDFRAALEALDEAAVLESSLPPGAAGGRARRGLLRARVLLDMGDRQSVERALAKAQRTLEGAGLDEHPLMADIRAVRAQTSKAGTP